jgi:hypothetical protein
MHRLIQRRFDRRPRSRRSTMARAVGVLVGAFVSLVVVVPGQRVLAAQGDCGQPVSSGDGPTATDALFVLRVAVGLDSCEPCVCDVDGSGATTAGDALLALKVSVGEGLPLACVSCGGAGGALLYGVGFLPPGDGMLYRIENYATSPTAVEIGGGNLSLMGDIAIDPTTGEGYGVQTSGGLFRIDLETGALLSSVASAGANPNALTFSDDGTLYSWGGRPQNPGMDTNLYVLDKVNGGGEAILDTGFVAGGDLAYDRQTGFLYGSTTAGDLIRIDLDAPSVTVVGRMMSTASGSNALGLEIDPVDGTMYALVGGTFFNSAVLHRVDKDTAEMTLVGNVEGAHLVLGAWGLAFGPVSEP